VFQRSQRVRVCVRVCLCARVRLPVGCAGVQRLQLALAKKTAQSGAGGPWMVSDSGARCGVEEGQAHPAMTCFCVL
jgi:hypothetical protein